MKLGISEILEATAKLKSKQERVDFLRKNNSNALMTILDCAFNPDIIWNLPEGTPPYKVSDVLDGEGMLYQEIRRLYLFMKGRGSPVEDVKHTLKREALWLGLLNSVTSDDAKLLCAIKDKKLPSSLRPITLPLIQEAFPGFLEHIKVTYEKKTKEETAPALESENVQV
jgi:hypothetical protein